MAVQTERGCPAPPSLRRRSHRFDSVLKAGFASTMAAYGKTITPGVFSNGNLHACLPSLFLSLPLCLWLSYTAPQMERRQRRELSGLLLNGVCILSKWVMLPFFALLVQGHLPYTSTLAQLLPSYYACSSITLLITSLWNCRKVKDDSCDLAEMPAAELKIICAV